RLLGYGEINAPYNPDLKELWEYIPPESKAEIVSRLPPTSSIRQVFEAIIQIYTPELNKDGGRALISYMQESANVRGKPDILIPPGEPGLKANGPRVPRGGATILIPPRQPNVNAQMEAYETHNRSLQNFLDSKPNSNRTGD